MKLFSIPALSAIMVAIFFTISPLQAATPPVEARLAKIKSATAKVVPVGNAISKPPHIWRVPGIGLSFHDCNPDCPELIVVPAGQIVLLDSAGYTDPINIKKAFAVSKFSISFAEWDACAAQGGCAASISDSGWGRKDRPAVNVTWDQAKAYSAWLTTKTGYTYRLLSESEYQYINGAGSATIYWWGDALGTDNANCQSCGSRWDGLETAPGGSFKPNTFGLYDTTGNVWSWVEDCYNPAGYNKTPTNGLPNDTVGDCNQRIRRGGSWTNDPLSLGIVERTRDVKAAASSAVGFRVAREF